MQFKKMVVLLKILTPFFGVLAFYFYIVNVYIGSDFDKTFVKVKTKSLYAQNTIPREIDYLVLGDSSAFYGINPLLLTPKSYSAANIAQTLYLSHQVLSGMKNIDIKKGIIITQTFATDHYDTDIWDVLVPSDEIKLDEIYAIKCGIPSRCDNLSRIKLGYDYLKSKLFLRRNLMKKISTFILENDRASSQNYSKWFENNIRSHNGQYALPSSYFLGSKSLEQSSLKFLNQDLSLAPSSELYFLERIKSLCLSKNIPLYFFITPTKSSAQANLSPYKRSLDPLLSKIKRMNIEVVDGNMIATNLNEKDFVDFNHLNENGANKLTRALAAFLKI